MDGARDICLKRLKPFIASALRDGVWEVEETETSHIVMQSYFVVRIQGSQGKVRVPLHTHTHTHTPVLEVTQGGTLHFPSQEDVGVELNDGLCKGLKHDPFVLRKGGDNIMQYFYGFLSSSSWYLRENRLARPQVTSRVCLPIVSYCLTWNISTLWPFSASPLHNPDLGPEEVPREAHGSSTPEGPPLG